MKPNFLKFSILFATVILCLQTCKPPVNNKIKEEPDNSWIEEFTIIQLQEGYKDGKYTITDVVKVYLDRIIEIDRNGPELNSIIEINPDALQIAEELDRELTTGKMRGPLHGIPVILKDNIDTHDRMPTTAGATALTNSFPKTDSYVAITLGALTGIDSSDSKTLSSDDKYHTDYTMFLKKDGLKGKRIGLFKKAMGFSDKVDTLMINTATCLKENGAEVIEIEFTKGENYGDASFVVMLYEFKDGLNKYFAGLGSDAQVKSLKELIEFNKSDTVELRYFDQKLLEMAEKKGDLESVDYKKALASMTKATREEGIDKVMNNNKLDAIMAPTGTPAWKTDHLLGDHFVGGSSSLAAISGYPAITVPMGFIDDLPVGVTFFGRAWSEPVLLEIAYSYEQGTKHRKAPKYIVSD